MDIFKGAKASEYARGVQMESRGLSSDARRLRFTTNHDKAAWDGSAREFFGTTQGAQVAFAISALYSGCPLIYTGQEVDWPGRIPFFQRIAIDWAGEQKRGEWMSKLLAMRDTHASLRANEVEDLSSEDVVAFTKKAGSETALVLANVRSRPVEYVVPRALQGRWSWVNGGKSALLGASQSLASCEYRIFIRKKTQ